MTLKSSEVQDCSWWISTILIYFCFLLLLPCFSSICRQTNDDNTRNVSEDCLWFSRIQSLHHFLWVDFHDEEDESISSTLHNRRLNILLVQHRSKFFPQEEKFLWMSWQNLVFVVLLRPLIGMQNPSHPILTHIIRAQLSGISCSLFFKFITNLFDPWEILTQEWVLPLFTDEILISTPYLPCKQQVATSNTGPILVFPWIHPFGCDASSSLGRVYSRQATARNCENSAVSFVMKYCPFSTTFRNPASIQNLLNLSCCDNFSIRSPYLCNRRSLWSRSSQSKGTFVLITLGTNEELDCPHTTGFPVLSWKDSSSSHISATAP